MRNAVALSNAMYQERYRPGGVSAADSLVVPRSSEDARDARRERLGSRVRQLRVASGMTQEQLAEACGLDRKTVNRFETGALSPAVDRLFVIADALGVTASQLLDGVL